MGAEFSRNLEEEMQKQQQQQQQQLQRAENSQPQQQLRPQSQPQPQPQQQRQQQLQREEESQPQQQQQPRPQPQPQQQQQKQQALTHEGTGREEWLLPYGETAKPSPPNNTKASLGNTDTVKPKLNQSFAPSVKPYEELSFLRNYEDILKGADSPVDRSSREKLLEQLYAGVFLDHKTKKYWVDKRSNANCFMLYARALSIIWAQDQDYWKWVQQKEASGTIIEVAELKRVCWLEVRGKVDTRKLSPGILYQVSFIVMLKDPAQGWEVPVNVGLVLPGGKKQQHKENLIEKLRVCWLEIPVGEFVASEQDFGEMEFSMYEYDGGIWKQGLVIKGVAIKPKQLS